MGAAHAAGLRVFQVPDLVAPSDEVRALGHEVVGSLLDVLEVLDLLDLREHSRGVIPPGG